LGLKFLDDGIIRKTLASIMKYNFKEEEGVINGAYPDGFRPLGRTYKNALNLPSSPHFDTPWSGVEFYLASHLVYEGMIEEAKKVLKEIYERYALAGNFWDHLEWGSHYMRPLSAISVIPAFEGLKYDGFTNTLTITPYLEEIDWVFLLPSAWGELKVDNQEVKINVVHGELKVSKLYLKRKPVRITVNGESINFRISDMIEFDKEINAKEGDEILIQFG
jgi:uncharacterized protein (DUF608 family)